VHFNALLYEKKEQKKGCREEYAGLWKDDSSLTVTAPKTKIDKKGLPKSVWNWTWCRAR
jgi:hypothetical protein